MQLYFWSGAPLLKCENDAIWKVFEKRSLKRLNTALFRLSNDLNMQSQIDLAVKQMIDIGYKAEFLNCIIINPVIAENIYPIEKCHCFLLVDFSRHPNE